MYLLKRSFVFLVIISLFFSPLSGLILVRAETDPCNTNIAGRSRADLEADLAACNADILKWTNILNSTKEESASYTRDVTALTAKINAATSNIKAKNIAIASLGKDITQKQNTITALDNKIEKGKQTLAELIRKTNELDRFSMADAMLSDKNLSDFFVDVDSYSATDRALEEVFVDLRGTKSQTQAEKEALAKQQQAAADAKATIEAAKKQVEISQAEKKTLLADSKNKEKTYSQTVADKQTKANAIREALFPLRDTGAIPFGTALQYANNASAKTGVRPALILAILQQESNLGANVGSCVITNLTTGETKSVNSGKIFSNGIHPTRDLPLLQTVLKELGRDPLTTKVSCPIGVGYGGAMGPAQFIPSTWNLISKQIAAALGKTLPDPWSPADAIMALAILLKGNGAVGDSVAERNAACKYYSGRSCAAGPGATYGTQVMAKAATIQSTMIDLLQ